MATTDEIHTPLAQRPGAIAFAAQGTPLNAEATARAAAPPAGRLQSAAGNAQAAAKQASQTPPPTTCQQCLTVGFFFDGTGNNLNADVGTLQHSNVARLFQSHPLDNDTLNRYSIYIPGLGTYFPEINDPGHTKTGLGFGAMGQDRLDWAFKQFDKLLKRAEARAQNPTNKILAIKLSVFGFSRGATAARAFVREMAVRCNAVGGQFRLKAGGYPVEVMFLGLFDTVASVGLPMSANNTPLATSLGWYGPSTTMGVRDITSMAFGEPGADPAPGGYDGHASWADGLKVPGIVKRCVHMVAGHEIRNSFPADSVLDGTRYPAGTSEMVYPGAHSDVGGGYQPGEGARSAEPGQMLSLIPLRTMHGLAIEAGVPLYTLAALAQRAADVKQSFALDDKGNKQFNELGRLFQAYMAQAGSGRPIGQEMLAHSSWALRWRFFNIRRNERAGGQGPDATTISQRQPGFAAARAKQQALVNQRQKELEQANRSLELAQARYQNAQMTRARAGVQVDPALSDARATAQAKVDAASDAYLSDKAQLDTAADDSSLRSNLATYDARLIRDAQTIDAYGKNRPALKLRPHYRNLMDAYHAQYLRNEPLNADVVAFFDNYVHDSLGGFAGDATLPSDPRVLYAGGDNKLRYASLDVPRVARETMEA